MSPTPPRYTPADLLALAQEFDSWRGHVNNTPLFENAAKALHQAAATEHALAEWRIEMRCHSDAGRGRAVDAFERILRQPEVTRLLREEGVTK